ncbi:PP2C family protein-serine/threonine phosphatase [Aliikangiella coralliicola]|nr:protein phosphatase 2C domain-containing protein [Aliikangiella coralliicola]
MDSTRQNNCNYAHISDVGCVRELNEDTLFVSDRLWLVADGMGGHACGEVASQLAAKTISSEFSKTGLLPQAIQTAHLKVVEAGEKGVGQSGMGTTVVALISLREGFEIAWVGDSRAYLWEIKKKRLTQLTEDHSLIVRLINSGLITREDAKQHPQRHMITQCLGSVEIKNVQVDTYQGRWQGNQQILLCSDGLTDDVEESEIVSVLKQSSSNDEKLAALVDLAKSKGGKDNISIILVESPVTGELSLWEKLKSIFK